MAVKAMIRSKLILDGPFSLAVPDTRLFNAGSITTTPDLTKGKFAVLRFDPVLPGIGPMKRAQFFLYVYDRMGQYTAILATLVRAREVLEGTNPIDHGDGWITNIVWQGDSGELVDDSWRASVQFATFEVVYSGS
jgi:hypothetical protein